MQLPIPLVGVRVRRLRMRYGFQPSASIESGGIARWKYGRRGDRQACEGRACILPQPRTASTGDRTRVLRQSDEGRIGRRYCIGVGECYLCLGDSREKIGEVRR
jgi:hypothetical protein